MKAPAGYRCVDGPDGVEAFAREHAAAWVAEALGEAGTLHAAATARAAEDPGTETLRGRGPVPVVEMEGERWVVRHYFRGGAVAPLLHDRYLRIGTPRPVSEARWACEAVRRGVPTPPVLAGAVYPAGAFYRADIVTELVPRSRELADVLFGDAREGDPDFVDPAEALVQTARLIVTAAEAGLFHPDLNARNVLLAGAGREVEPWLIDLDRCRFDVAGPDLVTGAMVRRLERSVAKIARSAGRTVEAGWLEVLRRGIREGGATGGGTSATGAGPGPSHEERGDDRGATRDGEGA